LTHSDVRVTSFSIQSPARPPLPRDSASHRSRDRNRHYQREQSPLHRSLAPGRRDDCRRRHFQVDVAWICARKYPFLWPKRSFHTGELNPLLLRKENCHRIRRPKPVSGSLNTLSAFWRSVDASSNSPRGSWRLVIARWKMRVVHRLFFACSPFSPSGKTRNYNPRLARAAKGGTVRVDRTPVAGQVSRHSASLAYPRPLNAVELVTHLRILDRS